MGKRTVYREAVATQILAEIAVGKSLSSICRRPDMPSYRTVVSWVLRNFRGFEDRYWTARRQQCLHLSEEILTIADEAVGDATVWVRVGSGWVGEVCVPSPGRAVERDGYGLSVPWVDDLWQRLHDCS